MISLHNVASSGQALSYFSEDNYYTEKQGLEESEWYGRGAVELGFEGKIEKADFFAALEGNLEGQELGKWVKNEETGEREREHRPGTDITFSAPKSVSILAEVYGQTDIRLAHEEAVKDALGYMERDLSYTRQMVDGEIQNVKTGNLTVALFRHNTSRDLDPQTHTHAIIMNATKREDGAWRSIDNQEIYKAQRTIGSFYTAALAERLQGLGYELERTDDKGNFEVVGINRAQIEHFSQRRAGMEAAMAERGLDINSASAKDRELAALATRARKGEVDHGELINVWRDRAAAIGVNVGEISARAEANRQQGGVKRPDVLTGRKAMEFAAAHLVEREAVISKQDLLKTAVEHGAGRVSPLQVERAFNKLEKDGDLVRLPDGNYTTKRMLGSEEWSLKQVQVTKGQADRILGQTYVDGRMAELEKRQGFQYTVGQKEAISKALVTHDRYVAVQGLAGVGKTTMVKGLRELAEEGGFTVRGMAPTGAAAKVLRRETGIETETVSMFQIKERQLQKDIEFAQKYAPDFKRQKELWVVDESSFLSQRQMAQLHHMADKAGAKVVYLGDTLQLQSVEAGKPFEMAQKNGMDTAYMTEVNRQKTQVTKEAVGIILGQEPGDTTTRLTNVELRNNAKAFAYLDRAGMVKEIKNEAATAALVRDLVAMPAAERDRTIVITPYNRDRQEINNGVREGLKELGELSRKDQEHEVLESKGWTRAVAKEAQYYRANDVVRFGRDYKQLDVGKGEYTRVSAVRASEGIVVLSKQDGSKIEWKPGKNTNVEVYDALQRGLAKGDLVRFTRNESDTANGAQPLKNGDVARIDSLDGDRAVIALRQGTETVRQEVDLGKNKHWDHAYAQTVHASQGSTQHRAVFHIPAPEAKEGASQERQVAAMAKVFGNRSFYVGATRESHEISIYTNDKALAARAVSGPQDKTSAVETLQKHELGTQSPVQDRQPQQGGIQH